MRGASVRAEAPVEPDAESLARRVLALLTQARRAASTAGDGARVPLHLQDRSRWDRECIDAAMRLLDRAFAAPGVGATTLRAAIECLHTQAPSAAATDWRRIAAVYDLLAETEPTAEVQRERALAHLRCGVPFPLQETP